MSQHDPIASPTLAQLYIAQGHTTKARNVLTEVLERDPFDGHALHLRERLTALGQAQLSASVDATKIALRWQQVPRTLHALVVCFVGGVVRVDSVRCASAAGQWATHRPARPGSAVACLGHVVPERGFVATCVARPLSWEA